MKPVLLSLQASCQLFAPLPLPSASDLPSIHNESRPAKLVMAGEPIFEPMKNERELDSN